MIAENTKKITKGKKAADKENEELSEEEKKKKALESYRKSGKIAKEALELARNLCKPGIKVIDLIEKVEGFIIERGGGIGFPMNVSINNVAVHYTSGPRDTTEIEEGMVVKLDVGVHVDGYVTDTATTLYFGDDEKLKKLVAAAVEAMQTGIDNIKAGAKTNEIGNKIYDVIKKNGFNPIRDLSGHSLQQWIVHGEKQVPLIPMEKGTSIEAGDVIAIETFTTTGTGKTHSLNYGNIYQLSIGQIPKIRNRAAKKLVGFVAKNYKTLPFSHRAWMREILVPRFALNELINGGIIHEYKVLADIKGSFVAQSEKTVYIHEDDIEILT
ncbi:MAG: type II methionyl aminopeptidase [Promethearchaeota archaeon]